MRSPAVTALLLAGCAAARSPAPTGPVAQPIAGFWAHWGDGRAEVDHYALRTPRYGEIRQGTAILVYVTEDFTDAQRVKSDGGHPDEYPVWKLNDVRHFQTGVYDYEVMTSTFLRLDGAGPIGQPVKVTTSVQEWCGHAWAQLLPRPAGLEWTQHSYFDGEGDEARTLSLPADGLVADALPLLVRGWVGALVEPGGARELPGLPTLLDTRFSHRRPQWSAARIEADPGLATVTVPAGTFAVHAVSATLGGITTTWQVESAPPHRIVAWSRTDGEQAELVASQRLAYWQLHGEADTAALSALGLAPDPR